MFKHLLKKALVVCLCFGVFSCKKEKTTANETAVNTPTDHSILFSEFPETSNITFNTLFNFKEGIPNKLHIVDSTLVIHNRRSSNSNFLFYNYNLNSGNLSKGYISSGRGPNEILSSFSSGFTDTHLWIHDMALKKIVMIDRANVLPVQKDSIGFKEYKFNEHTAIRVALKDSLSYYGVENLTSEYKVSKMDLSTDTVVEEFGEFKEQRPETIPLEVYKQAYSPLIALNPNEQKLMLAYRYTDVVEIYNLDNKVSINIQGPENFKPQFEVGKNQNGGYMEYTDKTKLAFVNAATTKDYIYLLYSGSTQKDNPDTFGLANRIYVYNWDAKPIKEISFNKDVMHLSVSNNNKKIYSFDVKTGDVLEADIDL